MTKFEVRWKFRGSEEQVTFVLARDRWHAQDRIWLLVPPGQLNRTIEFLLVEELDG